MPSLNKKGLSQIVAIVLFIVMAMASVALIASSVLQLPQELDNQLAPFTSCIEIQKSPPTIISARYNDGFLEVSVQRKINEISSIDFLIETPEGADRYSCSPSCGGQCVLQGANQEKTFYFEEQDAISVTLLANGNCQVDEIKL